MKFWHVDAFSEKIFAGNPAAVFIVDDFIETEVMQNIAAELNLSESCFVKQNAPNHFHIRWFSPIDEAPLCGHATLAAAHILWQEIKDLSDSIIFDSLGGPLMAKRELDNAITLNFPSRNVVPTPMPELLNRALGYTPVSSVYRDESIYLVVLANSADINNLPVNLNKIAEMPCRAVTVTALNDGTFSEEFDFVSRYFAPKVGIPEDPVCGSAHCRLAPYWAEQLQKQEMVAYQASKRGGVINLRVENNRVFLTGKAIVVSEGNFMLS